jgi:hypothetical protein
MMPLMLLFVSFLSYGLLIPWLGFYWDDWPAVWVSHSLGSAGLREYVATDRPFQGWLLSLTTSLFGVAPLQWHFLALLGRWLSAVALWWSLHALWPLRAQEIASIAFLFAVYPGFTQQPIALIYSHTFIVLVLFVFSLGAMIWAIRVPRLFWLLTILALMSSGLSIMIIEYFAGLELLRPVLLWLALTENTTNARQRLRRTLIRWSPYVVVMGMFLIWRVFLFEPTRSAADHSIFLAAFVADPLLELMIRLGYVFTDVIESSLMAWAQTLRPDVVDFGSRSVWLGWGLVFVSAGALILHLLRGATAADPSGPSAIGLRVRWATQAMVVGLLAIVVGELPIWFVNREIRLTDLYDRYTLPAMLGACMLLVGAIQILIRTRLQQVIVVSMIVGLAVGFHFRNANQFRQDWSAQKSLFWQLSWRVPGLKSGTSVLIDSPPLSIPSDYALAAALNFIYAPGHSSAQLDYWFFNLSLNGGDEVFRLADDTRLKRELRTISFSGSTSDSLLVWFSPPSCLRVLYAVSDDLPQLSPVTRSALPFSHVDRIVVSPQSPARPPGEIFGPEPNHDWCYYFQKADLARQRGEWREVAQLGDEARRMGFNPGDVTEWLLFVEGYASVGRYDDAREITKLALKARPTLRAALSPDYKRSLSGGFASHIMPGIRPALYNLWTRLEGAGSQDSNRQAFIADLKARLSPPMQ